MSGVSSSSADVVGVLIEGQAVLCTADAAALRAARTAAANYIAKTTAEKTDARTIISDWTGQIEEREAVIGRASDTEDYQRTVTSLEIQKADALSHWDTAEKQCEQLTTRIERLKGEIEGLEQKKQEVQAAPIDLVPKQ
eukprot:m.377907 g.377907  ORF g.377907 m.377907 type:complete len:139 (+) comp56193_c0_seq20:3-419(+)